jgi:hypothetical protein
MKDMTRGERRIAPQQIAEAACVPCQTVTVYTEKAGWTENGEPALFAEKQAAIISRARRV